MKKSSFISAMALLLVETPTCMGGVITKLLRRGQTITKKASVDTRDMRSLSEFTPDGTTLLKLGYDKVENDRDGEKLVLTDVSRYSRIAGEPTGPFTFDDDEDEADESISFDVFLDRGVFALVSNGSLAKDLVEMREKENSVEELKEERPELEGYSLERFGNELKTESNQLRMKQNRCDAHDLISFQIFQPDGINTRSVSCCSKHFIPSTMANAEKGFKITELSSSFGRHYDPKLELKFDMDLLRKMEAVAKVEVPKRGAKLTKQYLTQLCRKQLSNYARYLLKQEGIKTSRSDPDIRENDLRGIVMWLTTGSYRTVPADLNDESADDELERPQHQLTIKGKTPTRGRSRRSENAQ
ncbi:hypothetical protein FOZ61_003023 [Perkinsus olseni]|uniref:Uncharacterized protein n=1 Tax=Perkinsus olseni TaxID=32597 RepID=A0A7J6MSD8_PEROL|nr:hypothetical protein FOZ61_003023 [Perkinsus olseni]KAF4674227.1 hypothetical protein FOL46_005584 [Perkinsus olseni]